MRTWIGTLCALALLTSASLAEAAAPQTMVFEAAMTSAAGTPVVDGTYDLTFKLYVAQTSNVAFWTETAKVAVKGGRASHVLGSVSKLSGATFAAASEVWLGVSIGLDPELPRRQLQSVPFAMVAQTANGLSCTGCVASTSIKWTGDLDLQGNSIKVQNVTAKGINAQQVAAQAFIGDGSLLTGIKIPSGKCPSGQMVTGIDASGNLICAQAAVSGGALEQVSNGALSNQFQEVLSAPKKNVPIPDNTGIDALSNITVPDVGTTTSLKVAVDLENTDLSTLSVTLLPPDDKKTGYVVCDPCGAVNTKSYVKTFSGKLQSGDLSAWVGKNPKGLWNLKVKDTSFCLPQLKGNDKLCDVKNGTDGALKDWSITVANISKTDVLVQGVLQAQAGVKVGASSAPCIAKRAGMLRYIAGLGLQLCDGAKWDLVNKKRKPIHYVGSCNTNGSSSTRNFCLSKTLVNTAQDYLTVNTTNSGSSTSWNTGRVTIKKAGLYRVSWQQRSRGSTQAWLYVNQKQQMYSYQQNYSSYYGFNSGSRTIQLKVGDYINLRYYSNYNAWFNDGSSLEVEFLGE